MQYVSCTKYDPCDCGHVRQDHNMRSRHKWCCECDCDSFTLKCDIVGNEVSDVMEQTK